MNLPTCSVWILVARTDVPFMMFTIPHLLKMSNFPFTERVLAIDTAPLSGDKVNRPGVGTMDQLRRNTQELLEKGIVDRVVDINYDRNYQNQVYQKHFGFPLRQSHNYKGYPILGTIFTIEECTSDYMLHFDSDMLLYQQSDFSWVEEAMKLSEKHPEIMSFRPLTGPPSPENTIYQEKDYQYDVNGFYKFKFFGSRAYLINKNTFDKLLPLPIIWRPYRKKAMKKLPNQLQTLLNYTFHKGKLDSWEIMISQKLAQTQSWRGVLADKRAWTLHPKDRSPDFIKALPNIIARIEAGEFPEAQAGHYDLISELWY